MLPFDEGRLVLTIAGLNAQIQEKTQDHHVGPHFVKTKTACQHFFLMRGGAARKFRGLLHACNTQDVQDFGGEC